MDERRCRCAARPTLGRAAPSLRSSLLADAAVWAAWAGDWSVLAVVFVCVADGVADGVFAWLRARASSAAGPPRTRATACWSASSSRRTSSSSAARPSCLHGLRRPAAQAGRRARWARRGLRHLAVLGGRRGLAAARGFMYWWDFVRGGEADVDPAGGVVAEPLRRLFVLQFGVLAGGLLVYWLFDSAARRPPRAAGRKTAADLLLAVLERLRAARILAAVEAGGRRAGSAHPRPGRDRAAEGPAKAQPRGGPSPGAPSLTGGLASVLGVVYHGAAVGDASHQYALRRRGGADVARKSAKRPTWAPVCGKASACGRGCSSASAAWSWCSTCSSTCG